MFFACLFKVSYHKSSKNNSLYQSNKNFKKPKRNRQ